MHFMILKVILMHSKKNLILDFTLFFLHIYLVKIITSYIINYLHIIHVIIYFPLYIVHSNYIIYTTYSL